MFFDDSASMDDLKHLKEIGRDHTLADRQYEIIAEAITNYEKELDENSEVALNLTHFNQNIVMRITELGYSNPSLIHYYGFVNDQYSELIQHVSQINFLLTSSPKSDPAKPRKPVGFRPINPAEDL